MDISRHGCQSIPTLSSKGTFQMKETIKMCVEFDESLFNNAEDAAAFHAWKRRKRREAIVEAVCAVLLVAAIAFAVKLWFVAEGFTPCAN